MAMTVDIVKANVTIHAETSGDVSTTEFMDEFAELIGLFEEATESIGLISGSCGFLLNGRWQCVYTIPGTPSPREFDYVTKVDVNPIEVKTTSNEFYSEEERFTIERIHHVVEHVRFHHQLVNFSWVNS